MTRRYSLLISWGCAALLIALPAAALYYLLRPDAFVAFTQRNVWLPIQWKTVVAWQWYTLWLVTALYAAIGLVALYFLRRAFTNFANGEFFNLDNSRDLERFSSLLLLQALATPLHGAASGVLLSVNHTAGTKLLSVSVGSGEVKMIAVAIVIWVMSRLLVEGCKLQAENRQFV